MNDHLSKPIDVAQLLQTLARWVQPSPLPATPDRAAHPAANTPEQGPPQLPGVNAAAALQRLGNSLPRYAKLLGRFAHNQASAVDSIREALARGALDDAHRHAHTLKGLAANIGADRLAQDALAVEQAIRLQQHGRLDALLDRLSAQLAPLLTAIARWRDGMVDAVPDLPAPALGNTLLHIDQLFTLLSRDDSQAVKQLAPIAAALRGHPAAEAFDRVVAAAQDYDYPSALSALTVARRMLEPNRPD
jgi:HPt (histidine-containing phosphotransfer) domain-containing protein